jgi:glycosyltransferase involved in cell wall biosynthesis
VIIVRIGQVSARYHPFTGGVETVVKNVAEHLTIRNQEVTVYSTSPFITSSRSKVVNGVRVNNYPDLATNEGYCLPSPTMLSDLTAEKLDILHTYNIHSPTTLVAYAADKLDPKPVFTISPFYHGRGNTGLAQMLWILYKPLARRIIRSANCVIVNSKAQRILIKRAFAPTSRIFTVYDGVNLTQIKKAAPFALDNKLRILLYVGRLEKYKNIQTMIAALKYLPKNYHLNIIGRGPFTSFLQNLALSLGLKNRVHFLGFQPDNIVYRWIKTAHVFLHLSSVETFGMTCIESLAGGTPVIANDDGFGLSETIALYPDNILACKVEGEPHLAIAKLIMAATELKPIYADVSQFSWEKIAENVCEIYEQVLESQ